MTTSRRRTIRAKGISVYPRRGKWAFLLSTEPDQLTGKRKRRYRGGFDTEDAAWEAAIKARSETETGQYIEPSRRTVGQFMTEWLVSVEHSIKPTTYANYCDNLNAYILPIIGGRRLQDITVPVLNAFYRHLLQAGRRKPDNNTVMYDYWIARRSDRDGRGPTPMEISRACGTSIYAARAAVGRFRRGRLPIQRSPGLTPKSVKNVHRLIHRAFSDAVAWQYISANPAEHASLPRDRRGGRARPVTWTIDELAAWLRVALTDRFVGMWVLAATTGMRRSELAGVRRDLVDLDRGRLTLEDTRVVVAGRAEDSDGKTESSRRTIALDPFTISALRQHVDMIDKERAAFGSAYPAHGNLMCFEDGRQLHPDTISRRFNKLVDRAGVPRIRLHDVRHTYATLARDLGINSKIVTDRLGHANESVTHQIYTHPSDGQDRPAAEMIAKLITEALDKGRDNN
jgi:integrase